MKPSHSKDDSRRAMEASPDRRASPVREQLARIICEAIRERGLTQAAAAKVLEATQPDVSNLARGRIDRFSVERLERFLNALGLEVRIQVGPCPAWKDCAGVTVQRVESF